MRPQYVQLDRRFSDFDDKRSAEEIAFESYLTGKDGHLGWPELLASKVVVLLAEPGAGKTWELEAETERRRQGGTAAFFVRIDRLAAQDLRASVGAHDLAAFDRWVSSSDVCVFFLDSVDEAKLGGPR